MKPTLLPASPIPTSSSSVGRLLLVAGDIEPAGLCLSPLYKLVSSPRAWLLDAAVAFAVASRVCVLNTRLYACATFRAFFVLSLLPTRYAEGCSRTSLNQLHAIFARERTLRTRECSSVRAFNEYEILSRTLVDEVFRREARERERSLRDADR